MNHRSGIEVYVAGATNKYVTVTGELFEGIRYPFGDRTKELAVLLERFMKRPEADRGANGGNAANGAVTMTDSDLLAKAIRYPAVKKLMSGDISGYESQSEADLALCRHLAFWTAKDPEQMDRLFRRSRLMRPKWDERHGRDTYGAITIRKATEGCTDVYALVYECWEYRCKNA
jgi:primase-polymerase (primpol)-like protein